jgi:hypothetical protein
MSKITEELRELATIANILSKGNGSITITTKREPDYLHRDLFKRIAETITAKVEALNAVTDKQYLAMLSGADKAEIGPKVKLFFKDGEDQEDRIGKRIFEEMEMEKIIPPEKEPQDSVEKDTIEYLASEVEK